MKREEKERRKTLRKLSALELHLSTEATYLLVQELKFDKRARTKALKMARKRKTEYIQ